VVLSYYCLGLEFVDRGSRKEGPEEEHHDCGIEGRSSGFEC
jgi:hypothetical protein